MGQIKALDPIPLVEPSPAPHIYASGTARVDIFGNIAELTLYKEQTSESGDSRERIIVARITMPLDGLVKAHRATADKLSGRAFAFTDGKLVMTN